MSVDVDGEGESTVSKAALLRQMTAEDRDFVERIDDEYYKRVKTSEEFYRRKKLILMLISSSTQVSLMVLAANIKW